MTKGERIRILRERAEMSQDELARRMNTTKQTIYKYEKDIVTNIPSDRIEELAKILNSTPEYILGWKMKPADQGAFEAAILKDVELMDMIQKYMALDENKKKAIRQMVDTLSE